MAEICLKCAKKHIDSLYIGDIIVGEEKCSNHNKFANNKEGAECDNNAFFLRKRGKKIEVICTQCRDDTELNDTLHVDNTKDKEGEKDE